MFAQPSQSPETYTRYRDDEETSSGRDSGNAPQTKGSSDLSENQALLQEVLGETLIRNQENSGQLIEALRSYRQQHAELPCDQSLFVMITREVLRHRLGERFGKLPTDLFEEVGRALWTNEGSRKRVERFWNSLGAGA